MTVSPVTLAESIAALSVTVTKPDGTTGALSIKAPSLISASTATPPVIDVVDCPVVYPQYDFVRNMEYTPMSMGTNPFQEITYSLNYYYAHSPVGSGLWAGEHSAYIIGNMLAFAEAIAENCRSLGVYNRVDVAGIGDPAIVPGPNDKSFYGATIVLEVHDARSP